MKEVTKISDKKQEDLMWPVNSFIKSIDEYDEVLIIAKKKGGEQYTKFHSKLYSTFWWVGCVEAVKRMFMDNGLTEVDK